MNRSVIPPLLKAFIKFIVKLMYIKVTEMKKGLSYRLPSRVSASIVILKMFSVEQSYSRLFRPWDMSSDKTTKLNSVVTSDSTIIDVCEEATMKKRKADEIKRENRLRKIRGTFIKSTNSHQDATVSTTTEEDERQTKPKELEYYKSPVASLSIACDRMLEEPDKKQVKNEDFHSKIEKSVPATSTGALLSPNLSHLPSQLYQGHPGFVTDYLPSTDFAHALGVPPTDPLLLESLAQGYAMELEYARIIQQENEAKLLNARKQRPKKYKCPHCQVGFSNNGQLKGHIRIHTGERPFKCDEKNCGKSFTRNEELTRHKRIHSGVRPFPCPTCGKKFGRRDHLKKHTRTHYLQAERMMPVFVPLSSVPHGFPYLYGY